VGLGCQKRGKKGEEREPNSEGVVSGKRKDRDYYW